MADWTYSSTARWPLRIKREAPPTVVAEFEDGSTSRLEKHTLAPRVWQEKHTCRKADMELMLDFWEGKRLAQTFTYVTNDANDPDDTEATVRFQKPPSYRWLSVDVWEVTFTFIEELGG